MIKKVSYIVNKISQILYEISYLGHKISNKPILKSYMLYKNSYLLLNLTSKISYTFKISNG